ncbi:MAG: hypothetical protein ACRYFZ_03630 [Janthinobacterium lividum]
MKKLLAVVALASAVAACQQAGHPDGSSRSSPAAGPPVVAVSQKTASPTAAPTAAPADAESADFLRRYDLADLLQNKEGQPEGQVEAMNGFYGPDHYRLEVALLRMERDPQHPNHYLVQGKDRYKGVITPLAGSLTLTQVRVRQQTVIDENGKPEVTKAYAVSGTYELREDPTTHGAGVFRGRVAVDMMLYEGRPVGESLSDSLSKGGMTTFDGTWTSLSTGQRKPATWVANLFNYQGPQIASDFFIGERDPSINPKYAKLGWNKFWENDEWWTDSPGTLASSK